MVFFSKALQVVATAALLSQVVAHPGHDLGVEIAERNTALQHSKRDLSHCESALRRRGVESRQHQRRREAIVKARAARGLPQKRDVLRRSAVDESHLSSLDVTPTESGVDTIIFGNSTCALSPEGEEGPYYVKGEYIRSDISEDQAGVEVIWDLQFINTETCEPIEDLTADIWHCNATGVYAGVVATGNGDSTDASNIDKTFLRGLQTTDSDGVVQYTSIFPGYYAGRATHVHVETHLGGEVLANNTYSGGTVAHIGQFFFDQDLITEVNTLSPYTSNTNTITENADDRVVSAELENDSDPFLSYVLLGDSVSDGLFMWISLAVNTSATYTPSPAAELTADGGEAVSGGGTGSVSGGGMGGGNGTTGNGTGHAGSMPSGALPSGGAGNLSVSVSSLSTSTSTASGATTVTSTTSGSSSSNTTSSGAAASSTVTTSGATRRGPFRFFCKYF